TLDTIHEGIGAPGMGSGPVWPFDERAGGPRSLDSGPASEEAESLVRPAGTTGYRILRHPGFLVVVAGALLAAVSWRSLLAGLNPSGLGVAGGELLPVSGSASGLWHAWLDGWHGAGLGNALEPAPYLPVLAAGAWVVEHLPIIGASTSSVGVTIAWLLAAAIPLSAWTAYCGARVVTRARWPRAWAALAWASLATLTTVVAGGRLGAVVAHILLPPVAAGFVCAARRSAPSPATFGAALALAVLGAFNPALGATGAVAALVLLVAGHGRTRLHAAVLLLVPIGLLGPWVQQLVHDPLLLLTGPGLTVWNATTAAPWQLGLLDPGGPGSYAALLSGPIVLAGLLAMSWREVGSRPMAVFAVLAVGGLALGVASPHVILGLIPPDLAGAGGPITGWAGTGLDLAALALIAAALRGFDLATRRPFPLRFHWRQLTVPALAAAAILGVAASSVATAWFGLGEALTGESLIRQGPGTPAVAADQAHGPLGNRLLAITRSGNVIGYRLVGAEPGPLARDLPGSRSAADPLLEAAVTSVVGAGDETSPYATRDALSDLGVGFVTSDGASTGPLAAQLDATAGLTRMNNDHGLALWRVLPRERTMGSSRLRLVDARGTALASIPVAGDHGRTGGAGVGLATFGGSTALAHATDGRRLVVAEPSRWADHARVTFAGRRLMALAGEQQPTYLLPPVAGQLRVTLMPSHPWWRWGQLCLLLVVLFLAAPFGSARSRGMR
ncbi:MAG TPA: glycosyltransferase family 2 protein, partial [Dermatophilaceae bacterium]